MKNELIQAPVALHVMVSRISASSLTSATRKNSFIINDVPSDLQAITDEHMLAAVFSNLLHAVINHSKDSCIRVSAHAYDKVVTVHLRESHGLNSSAFAANLKQVQQLAEKIGGTVSVNRHTGEATTVVFSFHNHLPAAA